MPSELRIDRATSRIAWQGISLAAPADWAFSAFGGDWKKGSFRVDSPEGAFLEIEWSQASAKPDLKREFEASIAGMKSKLKRTRGSVEVKEKPRPLAGLRLGGGVPVTFSLKADSLAYGALWHSPATGRMMLAKVVGPAKDWLGPIAHSVLQSVEDHGAEDQIPWCVYGFSFAVPRGMRLRRQSLRSGHQALEFVAVRPSRLGFLPLPIPALAQAETEDFRSTVALERWGLADVLLRKEGFQTWLMGALWPRLKAYDYKRLVTDYEGHEGSHVQGHRSGILAFLKRLPYLLLRRDPRDSLHGQAWVCPESNRVFAVLATGGREESRQTAGSVATSIRCHE